MRIRKRLLAGAFAGLLALAGVACEADNGVDDDPLVDDPAEEPTP